MLRSLARMGQRVAPPLLSSSRPHLARRSSPFASEAGQALSDILAREYDEEMGNQSTDMPTELSDLQTQLESEWKIVDQGPLVRMFRTSESGLKVQLSFHSQDSVEEDYEDDAEYEEGEEPAVPIKFTVTGTKAGQSMVFVCISEDAQVHIKSVAISNTDVETIHLKGIEESGYQGPEFVELAENLQMAFHTFLEEDAAIDANVAAYVSMMADFKEQSEYVKFLNDAKLLVG